MLCLQGRPRVKPSRAAFLSLALASFSGSLAAAPSPQREADWESSSWTWTADEAGHLIVRLVRGSATIVRRPGPLKVGMRSHSSTEDPSIVSFKTERAGNGVIIHDQYPTFRWSYWRECLPTVHERGRFWASDVKVDAIIQAPENLPIVVEIMASGERHGGLK